VTYLRLSPRRETDVVLAFYPVSGRTMIRLLWIRREIPWFIPPGGTGLYSPRSRRVYACAPVAPVKAGRLAAPPCGVALTGA